MDSGPASILPGLLLIIILLMINAFFAAAEMAIVSLNKNKINMLADDGHKKALQLKRLMEEPSHFLATIQVGITLSGFFASASAATNLSSHFASTLKAIHLPYANEISMVFITVILSYFTLVLGELLPKRIALQKSESIAMFAIGPIVFISKITKPFVRLLSSSTNLLVRLTGFNMDGLEEKVSREELLSLIDVGQEHGVINDIEREMISGIFDFDDKLAKEVMTPRTEVFAIDIDTPIQDILKSVSEEKFSRIPVFQGDTDNIIGMLYIKDLFELLIKQDRETIEIREILRPALFVPETKNIDDLFKELQATKNHLAILIDEYGGFSGIVSSEDLIEEVMGNIQDEYDEYEPSIEKLSDTSYRVDGLIAIDEINSALNLDIHSDDTDTIGGFVMHLHGSIIDEEESIQLQYENIRFTVEKVSDKRIEKLLIEILPLE